MERDCHTKPIDKFGNKIYAIAYQKMIANGLKLKALGFSESAKKPNLFYKKTTYAVMFADMRGTEEVPIWKDADPLLYFIFKDNAQLWEKVRTKEQETAILEDNNCPYRFSFYHECEMVNGFLEFDEFHNMHRDKEIITFYYYYGEVLMNGYCKECGKDIGANSYHCSNKCKNKALEKYRYNEKIRLAQKVNRADYCEICKKKILPYYDDSDKIENVLGDKLPNRGVEHHVSYYPEEIIYVCNSCHAKIHKSDKFLDLRPPVKDIKKFYTRVSKPKKPQSGCPKCKAKLNVDKYGIRWCSRCLWQDYDKILNLPD